MSLTVDALPFVPNSAAVQINSHRDGARKGTTAEEKTSSAIPTAAVHATPFVPVSKQLPSGLPPSFSAAAPPFVPNGGKPGAASPPKGGMITKLSGGSSYRPAVSPTPGNHHTPGKHQKGKSLRIETPDYNGNSGYHYRHADIPQSSSHTAQLAYPGSSVQMPSRHLSFQHSRSPGKGSRGRGLVSPQRGRGRGRGDGSLRTQRRGTYGATSLVTQPGTQSQYQVAPGKVTLASRFATEGMRQYLQQCSYLAQAQWTGAEQEGGGYLPDKVQHFHTLYPLESIAGAEEAPSADLGVRSLVVKAINAHDGLAYVLRRVDPLQVLPSSELVACATEAVEAWGPLGAHPHLVALRGAFVSDELDNANALIFIHDYHPGALTLAQAHLAPSAGPAGMGLVVSAPPEEQLWSYACQLCSALRATHDAGLALRHASLAPSKVLVTGFGRLRVGATGVQDTLAGMPPDTQELQQLQADDVVAAGQLLLTLACAGAAPAAPSLDAAGATYSAELVRLMTSMLGAGDTPSHLLTWRHMCAALGEHMLNEVDSLNMLNDSLLTELGREYENGRLLRLLIKLGFVNERPGGDMDAQWSETGDRYVLKLFRDFVFHQVSDTGAPLTEWGHVIEALNKLDAGMPEKVLLLSRDETSMLVVSYADVKRCVETAYGELRQKASIGTSPASSAMRRLDYEQGM